MKKLYLIARKSTSTASGFKFLTSDLSWTDNPEKANAFENRAYAQSALTLVSSHLSAQLPGGYGRTLKAVRVEIETQPAVKFVG